MFHGDVGHRNQLSESDEPELKNELIQSKLFLLFFLKLAASFPDDSTSSFDDSKMSLAEFFEIFFV
jgi:hypothetical protein